MDEADKTIFDTTDLDPEERAAVRSGQKRGERIAMQEDPERFGMARQKALNRKKYEETWERVWGKKKKSK